MRDFIREMRIELGRMPGRLGLALATVAIAMCLALFLGAQTTQSLGPYGWIPWVTANTAADTATLVSTQSTGILIGTPTAAATYTTATATNLCALFPFVSAGSVSNFGWDWYLKNTSAGANTITIAGGSGVTLSGTGTAAQNTVRHFKVVLTQCNSGATAAATLFSLETTAF